MTENDTTAAGRLAAIDWERIDAALDERGFATTGNLLTPEECNRLIAGYADGSLFRSRIVMARHGYGQGEYQYFAYPLPDLVAELRTSLYPPLAATANRWNERLGLDFRYPGDHATYLRACHEAGQSRPTALILKYGKDDYNRLHQDLYGEFVFPLQAVFLLNEPGSDFTGGELVLTEQRPRMQSRAEVVPLVRGEGVIFAVNERPVTGTRGPYRVKMRHGVSRLRDGVRHTLGIIFHDAR